MSSVRYEREGNVGVVTLDRPAQRNAIDGEMHEALAVRLREAELDTAVRVVILTGAGTTFCSGLDLQMAAGLTSGGGGGGGGGSAATALEMDLRDAPPAVLMRMTKPSICALNGGAAGFGMDIALACDIRIAAASAKMAAGFPRTGVGPPESGGTWLLPRLVGWERAALVLFTGRKLSAEELLELGLVSRVVPDDQLLKEARALAAEIAANAPLAVRGAKRMMRLGQEEGFEQHVQRLFLQVMHLLRTEDVREGVSAFLAKRPPEFRGR